MEMLIRTLEISVVVHKLESFQNGQSELIKMMFILGMKPIVPPSNAQISIIDQTQTSTSEQTTQPFSKIVKEKLSLRMVDDETEGECPFCKNQFKQVCQPSLVIKLECEHECCLTCLAKWFDKCDHSETDNNRQKFICPYCRVKISSQILNKVCGVIIKERYVESLCILADLIPVSKKESDKLVTNLFLKHKFDICLVEASFFKYVGLVTQHNARISSNDVSHEEKIKIHDDAREKVVII
jgi:hypothetical protein